MDNPDDLFDILTSRLIGRVQGLLDSEYEPDDKDVAKLAELECAIQAVERASRVMQGYK